MQGTWVLPPIWIYDKNHITIKGNTALTFPNDVACRFASYHWNVLRVSDANDLGRARRGNPDRPEGAGAAVADHRRHPHRVGRTSQARHFGGAWRTIRRRRDSIDEASLWLAADEHFFVPPEVLDYMRRALSRGEQREREWNAVLAQLRSENPDLAGEWDLLQTGGLPPGWDAHMQAFPVDPRGMATREAGAVAENAIAKHVPWMVGGSADLSPSTRTRLEGVEDFSRDHYHGRNFHFGIREHAMGAILNGMALSNLRVFGSTFLIFSDYMRPAIRLSALMELPVIYVFTHDSIGLGEDGPTHQPIEQLMSLRLIPRMVVVRPGDANETAEAWRLAMQVKDHPIALVLTRQAIPIVDRTKYASAEGLRRGAYVLADSPGEPQGVLMASGSEVQLCLQAHEQLTREGIRTRVVSMPSWELFNRQEQDYRDSVLPPRVHARVAVEAGSGLGWREYLGSEGRVIALYDFGASAPVKDLLRHFGFTAERVAREARTLIERS